MFFFAGCEFLFGEAFGGEAHIRLQRHGGIALAIDGEMATTAAALLLLIAGYGGIVALGALDVEQFGALGSHGVVGVDADAIAFAATVFGAVVAGERQVVSG